MTLWGKKFSRIPDERRNGQYAHRTHEELCRDLSRAFDRMWVQQMVISALCVLVTGELAVIGWLATGLLNCLQAQHGAISLLR